MAFLLLLAIGLIIWLFNSSSTRKQRQRDAKMLTLQQSNQGWIDFIAGYALVAKTKSEKSIIAKMLADIETQHVGVPSGSRPVVRDTPSLAEQEHAAGLMFGGEGRTAALTSASATGSASAASLAAATSAKPKSVLQQPVQLDNASLLLYFGAFLFVASAGLFVAFGNALGVLKVLIVLAVTTVMYASGIWLYHHRPKLRQAGQAFAGIGVVLAPVVGAATYAYAFDHQYGMPIWLITSLFCLGLYAHALRVFRNPLMGYVFIFTFLSLFESGVGVTGVPVYYYGWGLAATGIALQLLGKWRNWWPELREPSKVSSQVFLPMALLVSIFTVPKLGATQLGISLLLVAAFYYLEISRTAGNDREANAMVSHGAAIAGFTTVAFGHGRSWLLAAAVIAILNGLQIVALAVYDAQSKLWRNFGSVLMVSSLVGIVLTINHPPALFFAVALAVTVGAIVWVRQRRPEAYVLSSLAWMSLPYIYGQFVASPLNPEIQTFLGLASLTGLLLAYFNQHRKSQHISQWNDAAAAAYTIGAVSVLVASVFTSPLFCLATALAITTFSVLLAEHDTQVRWPELAALLLIVPLARSGDDPAILLVTVVVVLAVLIVLALRYRRELMRWMSTGVWLLLPFALGYSKLGGDWSAAAYAWGYIAAMVGLILSRAIARGVVFLSGNVPIASMMRNASFSYVAGYVFAAILALGLSLSSSQSQLHTSVILAGLIVVVWVLGKYVEKREDIIALVPLMAQGLLLSSIRPDQSNSSLQVFVLLSSALACMSYASTIGRKTESVGAKLLAQTSLIAAFVAPAAGLVVSLTWGMPVGLIVAGALLMHYFWLHGQSSRELAGGVIALGVMWFVYWAGIREFQAYSHIAVALLGLYAYWRTVRHEDEAATSYLWAFLATATVPLALEALSATSNGGLYGWWLLLEQVAIMLLGMSIGRRFVTMWGLYVAVGAVLYQLRSLGYGALALLALFLIGLAVYRLQKKD